MPRPICLSLLIAGGAHPKQIQAHLGHASITTTLNTYGHLLPSLADALGERLDAAYRGPAADQMRTNEPADVVKLRDDADGKVL